MGEQIRLAIQWAMAGDQVDLRNRWIGDQEVELICMERCDLVDQLYLSQNRITAVGMERFRTQRWCNLYQLSLDSNRIGNLGCKHLSRTEMNKLVSLDLNSNSICGPGVLHLCKSNWKNLRDLKMNDNYLRNCVKMLVKGYWKQMEFLDIRGRFKKGIFMQEMNSMLSIESQIMNKLWVATTTICEGQAEKIHECMMRRWKSIQNEEN